MALNTYFRGIRFIKGYLIKYLQAVFYAAEKGQLILTDGTKKIEFSRSVWVGSGLSWEEQNLPAVLIGGGRAEFPPLSISKSLTDITDDEIVVDDSWRHYGGHIIVNLDLSIRAKTIVERDNLSDITCLYLSHPDAKDFFGQQNIVIHSHPTVGGDANEPLPKIDLPPVYISNLSFGLTGQWDYREEITEARLETIVVDIIAQLEL